MTADFQRQYVKVVADILGMNKAKKRPVLPGPTPLPNPPYYHESAVKSILKVFTKCCNVYLAT